MNNTCPFCGRPLPTSAEHIHEMVEEADLKTSGNEAGEAEKEHGKSHQN